MHPSSLVRKLGTIFGVFLALNLSCGGQPLVVPATAKPAAVQAAAKKEPATRVLKCRESRSPDAKYAYYAVDSMTRKLQRFPSLAEYAGLISVSSCEEALAYASAYDEYARQKPDFESLPDTRASGGTATGDRRTILPRLKIVHGTQLVDWGYPSQSTPGAIQGPIVRIEQVYWWANDRTAPLLDAAGKNVLNEFGEYAGGCTATFLNKNWILTAAHCMAEAGVLQNIFDNPAAPPGGTWPYVMPGGQPGNKYEGTRKGVASWIVYWPSSVEGEESSQDLGILGVTAYQFPHEGYDNRELGPPPPIGADGGPNEWFKTKTADIALLYLVPWNNAEDWLAPDVSQGSAAYIKAPTQVSYSGIDFQIAGYGPNPDKPDTLPSDSEVRKYRLYGAKAPKALVWQDPKAQSPDHPFGGYGSVKAIIGSDPDSMDGAEPSLCHGDSGGPLYVVAQKSPGLPPVIVVYAIADYVLSKIKGANCSTMGDENAWMRLEMKEDLIGWINGVMGYPSIAQTADEQKQYNHCRIKNLPVVGDVYQCWGEPCDVKSNGEEGTSCDTGMTCVGAGVDLDNRNDIGSAGSSHLCHVCPFASDAMYKSCECVKGQCLKDPSKQVTLGDDAGVGP